MQLGRKIRDLRCRRGFTVQQLAVASGLSKGFISQVENDHTSPSLATLKDLARALDTTVSYLVVEEDDAPYVVRERERPRLQLNGENSRVEVLSARPLRNLELLMAEILPGASAGDEHYPRHGEECLLCLEGRVTVTCGVHSLVLEAGDSCHFDGRAPHTIQNLGSTRARVLIAVTPAGADSIAPRPPAAPAHGDRVEVASLT